MNNYEYSNVNDHIIRIVGLDKTCCYLVNGTKKSILLDSGSGYGDLKKYILENHLSSHENIAVILTHGHHDHMGGADSFDKIYMNSKDLDIFKKFGTYEERLSYAKEMEDNFGIKIDLNFVPTTKKELLPIEDYQVFDLGNLHIKMIPVPGHTPGMMCPLIEEDRIIIFGDACGVSVLLLDEYSSKVSDYKVSLLNLKKYENDYDTILRNHGTFWSPKSLLDNVIECCDLILTNKDAHQPVTMHGRKMYSAQPVEGFARKDKKEGNILYIDDKAM